MPPRPDFQRCFQEGVALFNSGEFWHAHEAWEDLWRVSNTDLREFLKGLIHLAAAFYHFKRGTYSGGLRLVVSGLAKLERFPAQFCGIDWSETAACARRWMVRVEAGEGGFSGDDIPSIAGHSSPMPVKHW